MHWPVVEVWTFFQWPLRSVSCGRGVYLRPTSRDRPRLRIAQRDLQLHPFAAQLDHVRRLAAYCHVHRIAWALVNNRWPNHEIDHWDHNPSNNRISNLRDATPTENQHNRKSPRGYSRKRNKWSARILLAGKTIHLGDFNTEDEAHQAYLRAKAIYHPSSTTPQAV